MSTKIRSLRIDTDLNAAIDDYLKITGYLLKIN